MSIAPVARKRAGTQNLGFPSASLLRRAGAVAALLHAAMLPLAARAADNPQDILKKMQAVYRDAQTYEGTITSKISGKEQNGQITTVINVEQLKYKGPNLFAAQRTVSATGPLAARFSNMKKLLISDGKRLYNYDPASKEYMKSSVPARVSLEKLMERMMPPSDLSKATLLPPTTVQGRAAYVINIPIAVTPGGKEPKSFQYTIDRQNYLVQKIVMVGGTSGLEIDFDGQAVGGSIPASAFVFTPPAGAVEKKLPAPAAGGPAPAPSGSGSAPAGGPQKR
jgi:outer membrane lipoprotein-sorting protein